MVAKYLSCTHPVYVVYFFYINKSFTYIYIYISFMCAGNWDTLEVRPKAKGLDTRHELIKFYEENYSANLMHLVIYAKGK